MLRYRYSLEETTPPAADPISLAEVKTHLRVDHTSDDAMLTDLIKTVGVLCEKSTGLALINRNCSLYVDVWQSEILALPIAPLVSVTAINLYAEDGTSSVYPATNYYIDNKGASARIILKQGAATPLAGRSANGIEVQFTCGYGATEVDVPEMLKTAMKQIIAHLYENRGDSVDKAISLSGAEAIFKTYRRKSLL